jgi:hypothetical protein
MKIAPGLSVAAIRALARHLAERLDDAEGSAHRARSGRLFFPKRTHELSPVEGEAPDGLSADYMALAGRLNSRTMPSGTPDLLAVLLRTVEAEITLARIIEARLIEAMGRSG